MRFEISRGGSGLTYEIRNIVLIAKKMQEYGLKIIWENIGDPVQKGENIPGWMKDVLIDIINENIAYAYSPTKGIDATRAFIADRVNARGKIQITPEDIIFFNGLGDAFRFKPVEGVGLAAFDVTEAAGAGADIAQH